MSPRANNCPKCKSSLKVYKSHSKNIFEKILNGTGIWGTFRCHDCGWRGILLRKSKLNFSFLNLIRTFLLLVVVYYIVIYFIKNYTK